MGRIISKYEHRQICLYQLALLLKVSEHWDAGQYVGLVYRDRMRTVADKRCVDQVFSSIFGTAVEAYGYKVKVFNVKYQLCGDLLQKSYVGNVLFDR